MPSRVAAIAASLRLSPDEVIGLRAGDLEPALRVQHFFFGGATVRPLGAALAFHDVLTPSDGYWLDHPEPTASRATAN